jgi:hypothetical protein
VTIVPLTEGGQMITAADVIEMGAELAGLTAAEVLAA